MAVVVSLLPLLVLAVRVLAHAWGNPGGDLALIELRVRDVGSHTPLLGSYGRYGFNQPGPLWFYALALPYRVFGSNYAGLQLGVLIVNAAAVVTVLVIARRRGGTVPVLLAAALLAVLLHGLGGGWLADPWEPHGLTLPCVALVFLAGECGTRRPSVAHCDGGRCCTAGPGAGGSRPICRADPRRNACRRLAAFLAATR